MWLLNASATTDPCKQKHSKIEYANQYHPSIWSVYASRAFFCHSFIFMYINLRLFENLLAMWHKICVLFQPSDVHIVIFWTRRERPDLWPPGSSRPPENPRCRVTLTRPHVLLRRTSQIQVIMMLGFVCLFSKKEVEFNPHWLTFIIQHATSLLLAYLLIDSLVYERSTGKGPISGSWEGYRHLVEPDLSWSISQWLFKINSFYPPLSVLSAVDQPNHDSFSTFELSGATKVTGGPAETESKEPVTASSTESSCTSEDQTTPESQDLHAEKSDGEHECSAMEVE